MADTIGLTISTDGIGNFLRGMTEKASLTRGWLNRVAYPTIINAQRMRWASENATEGSSWTALNQLYANRKLRKYASYPGAGRKMLIATGRLVAGVLGDNQNDHYKLVSDNRLEVGTTIPYAGYVNEARNFTDLGPATVADLDQRLRDYLLRDA